MRDEALRRAILLCLISLIVPSLVLGSSWTGELYDLVVPLGPPGSALLHAMGLLTILTLGIVCVGEYRATRLLRKGRPIPAQTSTVVADLAAQAGIHADAVGFGRLDEEGIEAVVAGRSRVIRIGTLWVRSSVLEPIRFRFAIAHEIAHLASGDPRAERIVNAALLIGSLAMMAAIGRIIAYVGGDTLALSHLDLPTLLFVLRNSVPAILANLVALGTLAVLILLESRASARLREFHADAIARNLSGGGDGLGKVTSMRSKDSGIGFVSRLLAVHPPTQQRFLALKRAGTAFSADELLFVLVGYFSGTILEMTLQLNFVMASPGVSTLAQRKAHLVAEMAENPFTYWTILGLSTALLVLSQSLILGRMLITAETRKPPRHAASLALRLLSLAGLGSFIALATSQTVYFELSNAGWNMLRWIAGDPDRVGLHACLFLSLTISAFVILTVPSLRDKGPIYPLMVISPTLSTLALSIWFYF
ncbi:M48 family metalloprotease [Rhizobium bangladeshense]|uniref:M48 family metalloprotease n=1 Tax=Rhizobium bangladeshense TaxID=1138189 RepID=UPI001C840294|nr:M48 family metalloprotease [Rhizobium bangladeshense]MBX4899825.1 M48 family metalloprotease [Rhizobium bangladeshense]